MSTVRPLSSTLKISRRFVADFGAQGAPCFALAMIEDRDRLFAALVLKPSETLPARVAAGGFEFGHSVLGDADYEVIHFTFQFRGFASYNALLNPSNALVQAVVRSMVELGGYFILVVSPQEEVTVFQADFSREDLTGLRQNHERLLRSTTSQARYRLVDEQFRQRPDPPGQVLDWVCRDETAYLQPSLDPLEMGYTGADPRDDPHDADDDAAFEPKPRVDWQPLSMLPMISMLVEGELESNEAMLQSLRSARGRTHLLDDQTIERIVRLCTAQSEFVPIHREQLTRWRQARPSADQLREIERLAGLVERHAQVIGDVLAIARELKGGTINATLRMDPIELALAALTGRVTPPK